MFLHASYDGHGIIMGMLPRLYKIGLCGMHGSIVVVISVPILIIGVPILMGIRTTGSRLLLWWINRRIIPWIDASQDNGSLQQFFERGPSGMVIMNRQGDGKY
jgi:hypothetical protein